ncbi:GTPase [Pontibacter sp. SGAir0037]|uniref:GTPase n=1 Tax=Pontibacter sp. SGAir0037 TaxID=2571030 RepID=UPI0010CD2BCD|nr:GTPase [Pontibacter sp. SGAir0037]QCR22458.1 GTPase [Pontibacter sp. SGAir0037]
MEPKLLFVYNAETGLFNKMTDFAHKIISPATYACSLCALTYGNFTIKQEWAAFLRQLPLRVEFIYKNDWKFSHIHNHYPLVGLHASDGSLQLLLEAEELNELKSLKQLMLRLDQVLAKAGYQL